MLHKLSFSVFAILVLSWHGLAATHHVREGQSLNDAINRLQPGDTLLVHKGTYCEQVTIKVNGTPEEPITIKAAPGEKPLLRGSIPILNWMRCTRNDPILSVNGQAHKQLDKLYMARIQKKHMPDPHAAFLYENGKSLFVAQYPNQIGKVTSKIQSINHFVWLEAEAFGKRDHLLDTDFLGKASAAAVNKQKQKVEVFDYKQEDDYWNGAHILIHSHLINNHIVHRRIADFVADEGKIILDQPMRRPIGRGSTHDSYAIVNHPHCLDTPGEYYIGPMSQDGTRPVYLWPHEPRQLNKGSVSLAVHGTGIYGFGRKHVTIEGLTVSQYKEAGIRFRANRGDQANTVTIRGCTVEHIGGTGIFVRFAYDTTVEKCVVRNCCVERARGIHLTDGRNCVIRKNHVTNTGSTNISYYNTENGQIVDNLVGGAGVHGNGISCYINCNSILIARNTIFPTGPGITLKDFGKVVVFSNLIYRENDGGAINTWPPRPGKRNAGPIYIINNSAIGDISAATKEYDGKQEGVFLYNNIVHGGGHDIESGQPGRRANNLYTKYNRLQKRNSWKLSAGEINGTNVQLQQIFKHPSRENGDFSLKENSMAVGKGQKMSSLIAEWGLKALFPGFDFGRDIAGTPWRPTPSVGCYELRSP